MQDIGHLINYHFKNRELLTHALTHSSVNGGNTFDRLEYLGDAVLELCVSQFLFDTYPQIGEGQLTKFRAGIVSEPSLAVAAKAFNLHAYIILGKGEENSGGREKASIISDTLEALIGAIYLDGGLDSAKEFIFEVLHERIVQVVHGESKDSKSELQEVLQSFSQSPILYRTLPTETGGFYSEIIFQNSILGCGSGIRKKAAEQNAAKEALNSAHLLAREHLNPPTKS